ncbi:MAG TPA: hypothetical protein VMB52_06400 [Verrucomicrobiae bacterium]|nr:hypothetical protein [Verrucomicrobiae bacterium]
MSTPDASPTHNPPPSGDWQTVVRDWEGVTGEQYHTPIVAAEEFRRRVASNEEAFPVPYAAGQQTSSEFTPINDVVWNYHELTSYAPGYGQDVLTLFATAHDLATVETGAAVSAFPGLARERAPDPTVWAESARVRLGMYQAHPVLRKEDLATVEKALSDPAFKAQDPNGYAEAVAFLGFYSTGRTMAEEDDPLGPWVRRAEALDRLAVYIYGGPAWREYKERTGFTFNVDATRSNVIGFSDSRMTRDEVFTEQLGFGQALHVTTELRPLVDSAEMERRYNFPGAMRCAFMSGGDMYAVMDTPAYAGVAGGRFRIVPIVNKKFQAGSSIRLEGDEGQRQFPAQDTEAYWYCRTTI